MEIRYEMMHYLQWASVASRGIRTIQRRRMSSSTGPPCGGSLFPASPKGKMQESR